MDREDIVSAVIAAAGGEVTGRVRLQKIVYLLDQLGLKSGFEYEYYHYGPYSSDLTAATEDAKAFDLVEEQIDYRRSDGAQFSKFSFTGAQPIKKEAYGKLGEQQVRELLSPMMRRSATVLELAATVDWLRRYERVSDWRAEIKKRKGVKTEGGRLEQAVELLNELGLQPK